MKDNVCKQAHQQKRKSLQSQNVKFKPGYAESYQLILFFLKLKIKTIKVECSQTELDLGSRDF